MLSWLRQAVLVVLDSFSTQRGMYIEDSFSSFPVTKCTRMICHWIHCMENSV
jgi:hypothetical protein